MDSIIQFMSKIDIPNLIAIGAIVWFFYSRLDNKIEKLDSKISGKIEKLDEKINDIDKRVFAIETMLHMKDCCMLKDSGSVKKVD